MSTSQTSILSEIRGVKPISARTKAYYRRRLQNLIHKMILKAFRDEAKKTGLNQKELARRIGSRPEQVNRWLGIPNNLTLNTIADMLLGIGVDLDKPSVTPIQDLIDEAARPKPSPPPLEMLPVPADLGGVLYVYRIRSEMTHATYAGQLNASLSTQGMRSPNEEIYRDQSAVYLFTQAEYLRNFAGGRISGGAQSEIPIPPYTSDPRAFESAGESGS
jgi:transcriptional regulator with XRE-family HTH domain